MIVAGFGMRTGATTDSLRDALAQAAGGRVVDAVATLDSKIAALSALNVPVIAVPPDAVPTVPTITHSPAALAAHGTGSVAEAAALVAAGPGATLLGPRHISTDRMATCAIAQKGPQ